MDREDRKKPLIMIVNDDGVDAPGFIAAVRAMRVLGDVLPVAPAGQQTAMGRAYPRYPNLGVIETYQLDLGDETVQAYAVHSSPAHAVCYGVMELAPRRPDLVVSGINHGANLGMSVTCSGTIGACLEAMSEGLPALALSLETGADEIMVNSADNDFQYAEQILCEGMPRDCEILSINIPNCAVEPEDYRFTCLDRLNYYEMQTPPPRDFSKPYTIEFKIDVQGREMKEDGDIACVVRDRLTSVTPLGWDLTKR